MLKGKKAEMGIGTLIIFIAMILVAAIAAAVLIQTATSLQNKALLTGDRSRSQISTSLRTLLLYATDGSSNGVEHFCQKLKLAPGSDPIKFSDTLIEFDLDNQSSDMNKGWKVDIAITTSSQSIGFDIDEDGYNDYIQIGSVTNGTHYYDGAYVNTTGGTNDAANITFNLTNGSAAKAGNIFVSVKLVDWNGTSVNMSKASTSPVQFQTIDDWLNYSSQTFGRYSVLGKSWTNNQIPKTINFIVGNTNHSHYSAEYLIKGSSYVDGYLQRGDVAKLCYVSPRSVQEDEDVIIHVIPKVGNPHTIESALPDIMTDTKIYIYP